jgi:hypothetical protein
MAIMHQRFSPAHLSIAGLLLLAACGNSGSDFGSTTGTGTSTGTSSGTAGSSVSGGTGGDTSGGTGGDTSGGTGGNSTSGAGGNVTGMGGNNNGGGGAGPGTGGSSGSGGSGGGAQACLNGYKGICHEFYANDNNRNQINYVNQFTSTNPGGIVWTSKVSAPGSENSPRTIEIVTADGSAAAAGVKSKSGRALLVSVNTGFEEYDAVDGTKVASVLTQSSGGVTGACRLPDGNTALGINPNIKIVSPTGTLVRQFALPAGPELRAINRNPADGHFWFSKMEYIYETDDQGNQQWKGYMGVGTKGYAVWWREGGGAFATTGEPASIVEVNNVGAQGTILDTTGGQTVFPFLDFFSGFVRLKNGNYIVANWLGHLATPSPDAAQVVEFAAPCGVNAQGLGALGPCANPKNEVVWQWECPTCPNKNQTLSRQITNVYVLR